MVAFYQMRLGDKEQAVESLHRVLENKKDYFGTLNFNIPFLAVEPTFEDLRGDSRFQEILRKMNLQ
jgi:hypothetical protein